MTSQEVLAVLRRHADDLRSRGVQHAALFGSVARDEADGESDIDILIKLAPDAQLDLWAYVGLKSYVAELFTTPVDVVDVDALKPHVRGSATADAIYAL